MDPLPLIPQDGSAVPREPLSRPSLRLNVSESVALRRFGRPVWFPLAFGARRSSLRRVASVFVPFALYRVSYLSGRQKRERFIALDQVDGTLDLFEFPGAIGPDALTEAPSRNLLAPLLATESARALLLEKFLRTIFQQGFFQLGNSQLQIDLKLMDFYIPYWLGFYGEDGSLHCRVLDAVRNRMEGNKATRFFEDWLTGTGLP